MPQCSTVLLLLPPTADKITRAVFGAWMEILQQVPGSVLWLLGGVQQSSLQSAATAAGIDASRIVFAESAPKQTHVQRTALADIYLDCTFNAGGSAADTLWAGVPIITLAGDALAARLGVAAVTPMGFPELAVTDWAAYKQLAVALATDLPRLRDLQTRLSVARSTAALFDTHRCGGRAQPATTSCTPPLCFFGSRAAWLTTAQVESPLMLCAFTRTAGGCGTGNDWCR